MTSLPDARDPEVRGSARGPFQPWIQTLLIVSVAAAAFYLITDHWLHILDTLPYLGVVIVMGLCMFGHGSHGGDGGSHQDHRAHDGGEGSRHSGTGGGSGHVQ